MTEITGAAQEKLARLEEVETKHNLLDELDRVIVRHPDLGLAAGIGKIRKVILDHPHYDHAEYLMVQTGAAGIPPSTKDDSAAADLQRIINLYLTPKAVGQTPPGEQSWLSDTQIASTLYATILPDIFIQATEYSSKSHPDDSRAVGYAIRRRPGLKDEAERIANGFKSGSKLPNFTG